MKKSILYSAILAIVLFPSFSFAYFDVSLKYGSRGDAVSELQDFLQDQGNYSGKVDGRFGLGTLKSVKAFQTANNLSSDGYFGAASRAVAKTILATSLKSSDDAEKVETGSVSPATSTLPGCTSTLGFSITTGKKCDGTTTEAPKEISNETEQSIKNSNTEIISSTKTQIADPLRFISGPVEGDGLGLCNNCIWVSTNRPTKVTMVVDGNSYTSSGYSLENYFVEFPNTEIKYDGPHQPNNTSLTQLNLDSTQNHIWNIDQMTAVDTYGNTITGYSNKTTQTIPKFCHDYNRPFNNTTIPCK